MDHLISLYFAKMNIFFPLLHRATFLQSVVHGIHRSDHGFANTLLLVCAIGSMFTDDPRVLSSESDLLKKPAGSRWFNQVPGMANTSCIIRLELILFVFTSH